MTPTYQPYTPPPVAGITFAAGTGQPQQALPPGSLCTMADAKIVHAALGGTLVNAADYPDLNYTFVNLDPASPNQPWMIIGIATPGFVGPDVIEMYAKGIGHPGTWQLNTATNQWAFVFAPDPPPPAVPPAASNPADAAAFAQAQGVPGTPGNPSGGTGGGMTAAEDAELKHVEKMLEAELAAERIPDPGQ